MASTRTRTFPQPHDSFELLFGGAFPGKRHVLDYIGHHSQFFPIGYIGGGSINAAQARTIIEEVFGEHKYGPIIHLALAPHDGSLGFGHNNVHVLDETPRKHTTIVGDAIIVRKERKPFVIETLLGDCACIIASSSTYAGFIYCGTPELFAVPSILANFWSAWSDRCLTDDTRVFLGPCITARNYAYNADKVPDGYKDFVVACDSHKTLFDEGYTFGLAEAIAYDIRRWGFLGSFDQSNVDPFTENLNGNHAWASARYHQYMKNVLGQGDGLSPRDCAFFHYTPD